MIAAQSLPVLARGDLRRPGKQGDQRLQGQACAPSPFKKLKATPGPEKRIQSACRPSVLRRASQVVHVGCGGAEHQAARAELGVEKGFGDRRAA